MTKRPNWNNLLSGRCPLCGCNLVKDHSRAMVNCETKGLAKPYDCGFAASSMKIEEIKGNIRFGGPVQDNQAELNNL